MNPKATDADTFSGPSKRSAAAQSQFATSDVLYGGKEEKQVAKKIPSSKLAALGGSGAVNPAPLKELKNAETK